MCLIRHSTLVYFYMANCVVVDVDLLIVFNFSIVLPHLESMNRDTYSDFGRGPYCGTPLNIGIQGQ